MINRATALRAHEKCNSAKPRCSPGVLFSEYEGARVSQSGWVEQLSYLTFAVGRSEFRLQPFSVPTLAAQDSLLRGELVSRDRQD
jgi:hypothetical protein